MHQVVSIVGARPQFIKVAMLDRAMRARPSFESRLMHTGQHFDAGMSGVFFEQLGIAEPAVNLDIHGGEHGEMTGRMLIAIEKSLLESQPDAVVVFGDTNSTLAGALAAAKQGIPLVHVEAGLRHYNREHPEEINRVVADQLSDLLFVTSEGAAANLRREGRTEGIHDVGDLMFDAVRAFRAHLPPARFPGPYVVLTVHRAPNSDSRERLAGILAGVARCPHPVVFPVHPRTRAALARHALSCPPNVTEIEPVSYLDMLSLVAASRFAITDSGGLQKEAYFLGKRALVLRDETPWTELVEIGANTLVGTDADRIAAAYAGAGVALDARARPYGDGDSAERICAVLEDWLQR